jgi:hypothetical protein
MQGDSGTIPAANRIAAGNGGTRRWRGSSQAHPIVGLDHHNLVVLGDWCQDVQLRRPSDDVVGTKRRKKGTKVKHVFLEAFSALREKGFEDFLQWVERVPQRQRG